MDVFELDDTMANDVIDIVVSVEDDFKCSSLVTCRVTSMFPDDFQTF